VTDSRNRRIQAFTVEGTFLRQWGSWGSGEGQFNWPEGIAVDGSGTVYVTDSRNRRIQAFTVEGTFLRQWGSWGSGEGQFNWPEGIAVDGSGTVYVTDSGNSCILTFTSEGTFLRQWGGWGEEVGQFAEPIGIAVDSSGTVYVADKWNHRVQTFTAEGVFLRQWGSLGSGAGQFYFPYGIVVDRAQPGTVYVADSGNSRIQAFTAEGTFLRQWGSDGSEVGYFREPSGIAVDEGGAVYVADTGNDRIQVFAPDHPPPDPVHGLALNGSFEDTPDLTHWAYGGELPVTLVDVSHHGSHAVRLGAPTPAAPQSYGKAWLRQTMYIRPEWAQPVLSFDYRMYVNDVLDRSDLIVWLSDGDGLWLADVVCDGYPWPSAPPPGHDMGWRTASYDLNAFKGQTVQLIFENRNLNHDQSLGIWTFVDDVRVVDAGP